MNKKGFTLIELIMTIALLGIIASISFVSINSVIKKSKIKECEILVGNIKSATKEYITDNRYNNISVQQNGKVILDTAFLVENHYLNGSIQDPFNDQPINLEIIVTLNSNYTVRNIEIPLNCNK